MQQMPALKRKKASKTKGNSKEREKTKTIPKDDPKPPREPSNSSRRPPSASFRPRTNSQESFQNVCVQLRLKEEIDSEDTDSDDESYTTPPESNHIDDLVTDDELNKDDDPINPNTVKITDDEEEQHISEDLRTTIPNWRNYSMTLPTILLSNWEIS